MSSFFGRKDHEFFRIILLKFLEYLTDKVKKDHFLAKSNFVLRALRILGLEEMLKLSEVLLEKQVPLKKAAGEELIAWDDAADKRPQRPVPQQDAKVLEFPKKKINELEALKEEVEGAEETAEVMGTDLMLWQREITKQADVNILKREALKGYKKATEMYVVKTSTREGKDKIRFASTNGVLINKKQA